MLHAVPSSMIAGKLSDRYGRKRMVSIAGGIQAVVAAGFMLADNYLAALLIGALFGALFGAAARGHAGGGGYTVIFSVAILYFSLGTLFVARVKKAT